MDQEALECVCDSRAARGAILNAAPVSEDAALPLQVLVFRIDRQRYALPLRDVREVHRAVAITRLPAGPDVVEGVVNVRGELVPVLDLRRRMGLSPGHIHPGEYLIRAVAGERIVAIRADFVDGLADIDPADLLPGDQIAPHAPHVAGAARLADGVLVLHDLERFLTSPEAATLIRALRSFGNKEATE